LTEVISTQLGFVQSQAPIVLSKTRATTSSGADLASFTADYNLQPPGPLPPTYATDLAIFSRNQPSLVPQILLDGTIIQNLTPTPTSALQYVVSANVMDPNWSANAGGGDFQAVRCPEPDLDNGKDRSAEGRENRQCRCEHAHPYRVPGRSLRQRDEPEQHQQWL
jgi:hypothetical protein